MAEADLADPNPDLRGLFDHYDSLYFQGALAAAGFAVVWGSPLGSSSFGSCTFSKPHNTITLSEPILKYLSCTYRKNALLHEMIHAVIYVKHNRKDRQHGPLFRAWMDAINSCSVEDYQRPDGGYNITTRHDFSPEEPRSFKGVLWKCESCGDTIPRAINMGPPSDACCIENVGADASCGNMLCHWHNHKNDCCGPYKKTMLELDASSQKKVPGGPLLLLTLPLEMSKSEGAIQEYRTSALRANIKATKPNAEDKHLYLDSVRKGKSLGSSSSTKAGKRGRPQIVRETSVLPIESPLKGKQRLVAAEEDDLLSLIGRTPQSPSSTPKKAGKRHKPKDVQKPSGQSAAFQGKPNQKCGLVTTEKKELPSVGDYNYNDATSSGSDTSKKAGKQHKHDGFQKTSVLPLAYSGKVKLKHALITTEKDKLYSAQSRSDARSPGKPQITRKACSQPAYLEKRLNEGLAHRQHEPEDIQKTAVLPATTGIKLKASISALEKQRKGKRKRKPVREKEYAVMSVWLDYYESDRSSGSTEPLVNKRTERRRRERARILTYSQSKIETVPLINSRTNASVRSHKIEMVPCKDESMQQSMPPSLRLDNVVLTAANQIVATQDTGDQSQPSAPCLEIVSLQVADRPSLNSNDQGTASDIIDISDDD